MAGQRGVQASDAKFIGPRHAPRDAVVPGSRFTRHALTITSCDYDCDAIRDTQPTGAIFMELVTRLHERLAADELALGAFSAAACPEYVEQLAHGAELDFVGVDLQHGCVGQRDAVHLLRALQAADPRVTPLARVPSEDKHWIAQILDAGFLGFIAPLCESVEQAEALVRAAYYPPRGCRSVAGSIRASMYGDYVKRINDYVIVLPQIESAKGLERVEQIVAVQGVTGALVGPADLSLDCGWFEMGLQNVWSHPPFLAAMERVVAACRSCGKHAAIVTGGDGLFRARDMGFSIINVSGDTFYIRANMTADLNARMQQLRTPQN